MKKSTMSKSTIALAAAVLLVSGGFATAGDFSDLDQNDNGPAGGGHRTLVKPTSTLINAVPLAAGEYFDIDQNDNGNPGGGRRTLVKLPSTPDAGEEGPKSERFVGICLIAPIMGQVVCWN